MADPRLPHSTAHDHLFKLVMIGDSGVGKSCVLFRLTEKTFNDNYMSTIGVDFRFHLLEVDGRTLKLQVWDTAGQERFRTITTAYYKGADGIIMVYDITKRESFDHVEYWAGEIERHANPNTVKLLIGNKCDLDEYREVTTEEGRALAEGMGVQFFETSAKDTTNVVDAYTAITRQILQKHTYHGVMDNNKPANTVNVDGEEKKKPTCCK